MIGKLNTLNNYKDQLIYSLSRHLCFIRKVLDPVNPVFILSQFIFYTNSFLLSSPSSILVSTARCPENTFTCDSGECVTKLNPECDFVADCADGSDEARCGESSS